jgi:hypothetical protein
VLKKSLQQYFQAKVNISRDKAENSPPQEVLNTRGQGRGQENRRGRGGGRFFNKNDKGIDNDINDGGNTYGKYYVQCFDCKRFGHFESNCWKKKATR